MGGVGTSILGRPRSLPGHRRADPCYTLNCDEPAFLSDQEGLVVPDLSEYEGANDAGCTKQRVRPLTHALGGPCSSAAPRRGSPE